MENMIKNLKAVKLQKEETRIFLVTFSVMILLTFHFPNDSTFPQFPQFSLGNSLILNSQFLFKRVAYQNQIALDNEFFMLFDLYLNST